MRIIEITGEPILHGGQERFIMNILSNMDTTGFSVDALTPYECENQEFRKLIDQCHGEVTELHLPFQPGESRRNIYKPLKSILQCRKYDIAHIHSGSISVLAYAAAAARNAGIRKVIVHSHSTGYNNLKHRLIHSLFAPAMKKYPTDYLACSQEAGEYKFPRSVVRNQLLVVRNGIDADLFRYNPEKRESVRKMLSIPEDAYVIGHAGRLSQEKNQVFLINLFAEILKTEQDIYLLLVGDGELRDAIEKKIHEFGIREYVRFTGNVENVQDYYQAMDVFAFPSLHEGSPFVTLEAQAAGLPCIMSTAVPENAAISETAYRIPLSETEMWKEAVMEPRGKDRADQSLYVKQAGYDISETAAEIRRIYTS